jgi:serine/threonine protein kinase
MAGRGSAPESIPGYRNLTRIGHGGFSVVYRAHSDRLDREVAVKVLSATLTEDDRAADRFQREIQLVNRVCGHPNVVSVLDAGLAESGRPYLVMDYYAGGSLKALLARTGPLPVPDALTLIGKIADALAGAHEAGVLHRDIKPENILVSDQGEPALADFGIGRFTDRLSTGTSARTDALTIQHTAPEVLNGERSTAASDIYSLGSTLYELLDGRPPFYRDSDEGIAPMLLRILNDEPADPGRPGVPEPVLALLRRALAKRPADRFPSAAAFAAAVHSAAASPDSPTTALSLVAAAVPPAETMLRVDRLALPTPVQSRPRHRLRWRWALAVSAAVALAAGTTAAFVVYRHPDKPARVQSVMNAESRSTTTNPQASTSSPAPTMTSPTTTTTTAAAPAVHSAPPAPSGLTAVPLDQHTIRLTWTDRSGGQDQFQLNNGDTTTVLRAGTTRYDWGGLAASTYMCFRIRAYDGSQASDYVPTTSPYYVCATTPPSAPSSPAAAPSNLAVTPVSSTTIHLSWRDNSGGQAQFEINNGDTSVDVGTGTTSYDWGGLAPGTYMCFKIRAYDGTGDVSGYVPSTSPYYVCATTPG